MASPSGVTPQAPPYNFDDSMPPFTLEMYGNDALYNCVMAARAHHTIRLVWSSKRILLNIAIADVKHEYYRETGGPDRGLNLATSLTEWQNPGWTFAPAIKSTSPPRVI